MDAKSVHDIGAVYGDSVGAEVERGGDLLVGFAVNNHLQNFQFANSQRRVTLSFQGSSLLEFGVEDGFSGGDLANRGTELEVHGILEHIALRAGFDGLTHPGVLGVHAEH